VGDTTAGKGMMSETIASATVTSAILPPRDAGLSAMLIVGGDLSCNCCPMFLVTSVQADAIRLAHEGSGDAEALAEFRIRFPGVENDETALLCVRIIAGWMPFGPGRIGRFCRIRNAQKSELDRRSAARDQVNTLANEPAVLAPDGCRSAGQTHLGPQDAPAYGARRRHRSRPLRSAESG
jgi:hypothetical protein